MVEPHVILAAVSIPWGDWLVQLINALVPYVAPLIAILVAKVGKTQLDRWLLAQYLPQAVNYAIAVTEGAVAGKVLSVELSNKALDQAGNWLVANAPSAVEYYGPKLREFLLIELNKVAPIAADANAHNLNVVVAPSIPVAPKVNK